MRYDIYRVAIPTGASTPNKIERLQGANQWVETDLSKAGKYVIPMINSATLAVTFPAAATGTNLRFYTTYDPYLLSPVESGDVSGSAIELTAVNSWLSKSRTCPAELLSRAYIQPVLTNSSGVAQTQAQDTLLIFTLKAPTAPGQ